MDYDLHKAALHTMASCHSLRTVEGELVGDPLDLKMFGFTGWSFTEGSHDPFAVQDEEPKTQDCSIVKPPAGSELDLDTDIESDSVSLVLQQHGDALLTCCSMLRSNWASLRDLNSCRNYGEQALSSLRLVRELPASTLKVPQSA